MVFNVDSRSLIASLISMSSAKIAFKSSVSSPVARALARKSEPKKKIFNVHSILSLPSSIFKTTRAFFFQMNFHM